MPRKAVQIKISPRLKGLIEKEFNRSQQERHFAKRMKIIYHSAAGMTNQEVGKLVGCLDKAGRILFRIVSQSL